MLTCFRIEFLINTNTDKLAKNWPRYVKVFYDFSIFFIIFRLIKLKF